jgi:hypothetical protein
MTESLASPCWPTFPTLGDLPEEELDVFLDGLISQMEGQAFTLSANLRRRRRRLLTPPLTVARLQEDGVFTPALAPGAGPLTHPVDLVLTRAWVAEMPARNFEVKIVIGAEHEFNQNRRSPAAHARVMEGTTGAYLPVGNIPFLQGLKISAGASLNLRVVFLDGKTSSAVVSFLKSPAFKDGIRLVRNFNPVFATAAHYLSSLTEALLAFGKNRVVSQGTFGLHNYGGPLSGAFGVGDYLFAQLPSDVAQRVGQGSLRWDATRDRVMDGDAPLDANHLMIRLERSVGRDGSAQ